MGFDDGDRGLGLDGVRAPLVPGATDTQASRPVDEVLAPEPAPGTWWSDNPAPPLSARGGVDRACTASVLPLPPYSSDYDPIEELWSSSKGNFVGRGAGAKGPVHAVGETLDHVTLITN